MKYNVVKTIRCNDPKNTGHFPLGFIAAHNVNINDAHRWNGIENDLYIGWNCKCRFEVIESEK